MSWVRVAAPAKINLSLHITGRRDDGYHELDSLVTFAPVADRLSLTRGNIHSLTVEGPEAAGVPADMGNLALKVAAFLSPDEGVSILLEKHLPAASGIGGGSADAAAAWRAMLMLDGEDGALAERIFGVPDIMMLTHANAMLALGADIPMCLLSKPCRAKGRGEKLSFVDLPPVPAVLVNPRVPVSTAEVFSALDGATGDPMPGEMPTFPSADVLIEFLSGCRNDLEAPARRLAPVIDTVLTVISDTTGCGLARMSGSGATCFGLYASEDDARNAARSIGAAHPDWWVKGGVLGDMSGLAMPR